jgi:multiple sugar transport system ATP-binding protein
MEVYHWPANRFVAGFIGTPAMNFIDGELVDQNGPAFRREDWTVSLAGRLADAARTGQKATLGVRPEDVRLAAPAAGGLAATVELVEMLGDATVTTLRAKTHQDHPLYVQSKTSPRTDLRPGMPVSIEVDHERLHVFDPASGDNWVRRPPTA